MNQFLNENMAYIIESVKISFRRIIAEILQISMKMWKFILNKNYIKTFFIGDVNLFVKFGLLFLVITIYAYQFQLFPTIISRLNMHVLMNVVLLYGCGYWKIWCSLQEAKIHFFFQVEDDYTFITTNIRHLGPSC